MYLPDLQKLYSALIAIWVSGVLFTSAEASIGSSHDYNQVISELARLADQYPQNGSLFELGLNSQGETIWGLRIGNGPVKSLIVATHHGDEYSSTDVALASAANLILSPIENRTVYVVPVLNISGFNSGQRRETVGFSQFTADPNRDYPGPCASGEPYRLKSTKALADFIDREEIVALATLHAPGAKILYPWGMSTPDLSTNYDYEFQRLARSCAFDSGYAVGNSAELLYPADGSLEDFAFWKFGTWTMLFEVGTRYVPTPEQLHQIVGENIYGLRRFMAEAPDSRAVHHEFNGQCVKAQSFLHLIRHE